MKLICIHHAGGSMYSYMNFRQNISDIFEVITIELPGRGKHIKESLTSDCYKAINYLCYQLKQNIRPYEGYILFGHSMGAWLAYGICCALKREVGYYPSELILSGNNPPYSKHEEFNPDICSNEDFINKLSKYGGLPDQLLNNKSLLDYYIQVLRSDYKLIYYLSDYLKKENVNCKMNIIYSYDDPIVDYTVNEWISVADSGCDFFKYNGNHFTVYEKEMDLELKKYFLNIALNHEDSGEIHIVE